MDCWICGAEATTGEHRTKKSDFKSVLGEPTQIQPIFLNDSARRNVPIGSLNRSLLKSQARICAKCNNERTQPHDRAWEQLSGYLRKWLDQNDDAAVLRASQLVSQGTRVVLLNVHLYFVKIFGCHIRETDIPINIKTFADALLNNKAHPQVYLRFCRARKLTRQGSVGMTDISTAVTADGHCAFATWFYEVDSLAVNVIFAIDGEKREGLVGAWHPRLGTSRLPIFNYG